MLKKGLNYDLVTILVVIQACGEIGSVELGMQVHQLAVKCGYDKDLNVVNALINMYSEMGYIETSYVLFQSSSTKDTALWNSMISAYVERGCTEEAVKLINKMHVEDISVDERTIVIMLPLCLSFANGLRFGNSLHGQVIKLGVENNMYTINALLSMYGELNCVEDALRIFSKTKNLDVMSWNIMISALAHNELGNQAFKLFCQMHEMDVQPNSHTIISVLTACSNDLFLCVGRSIHGYAIKQCLDSDPQVNTAITEMYMQCSDEVAAMNLFESFAKKNIVSWNAMIAGYGMHGRGQDAMLVYSQMLENGFSPTRVTFVSALSACSHSGLVKDGLQLYHSMVNEFGMIPELVHYSCVVDLLARGGLLDEAWNFINLMPISPDASVLRALLGGCRVYGETKHANIIFEKLVELEPMNAGNYILLSNIYAAAGLWTEVSRLRAMLEEKGLVKPPGKSWIVTKNKVHQFIAGDKTHPQCVEIYKKLNSLLSLIKERGYVPDLRWVLHDESEEEKIMRISSHSEKLAIAFGLINVRAGGQILIIKNLRICGDCHEFSKHVSEVTGREIVMRDGNRFHHFINGVCSCKDYW
nr:putative pentatricopeptide repeat-containing protein At3g13770, mitochondrial [Ipomoea trifida]